MKNTKTSFCIRGILPLFAILLLVLTSGCASQRDPKQSRTAATASVPGTGMTTSKRAKVRSDESIKEYPVGRYVDSADSRIMHERHAVYRQEQDAEWNLLPQEPLPVHRGPDWVQPDHPLIAADMEQQLKTQSLLMEALAEQMDVLAAENEKLRKEAKRQSQEKKESPVSAPSPSPTPAPIATPEPPPTTAAPVPDTLPSALAPSQKLATSATSGRLIFGSGPVIALSSTKAVSILPTNRPLSGVTLPVSPTLPQTGDSPAGAGQSPITTKPAPAASPPPQSGQASPGKAVGSQTKKASKNEQ